MFVIENGKAILKDLDGKLKLVPADQADAATERFGWSQATPEDVERDDAEKRSGGLKDQVLTAAEEATRQVASGTAAAVRGVTSFDSSVELDPMGNPITTSAPVLDVKGADIAGPAYTDEALERRRVNPGAAALGAAIPAVYAGALLPGAGAPGLAAALGIDLASGAAQEATDAELDGEGINGEHILRNAGLNAIFSGAGVAIPAAARALVRGADNTITRAAKAATAKLEETGEEAIAKQAQGVLDSLDGALERVKTPKVENNPNNQKDAIERLSEVFEKSHSDFLPELKKLENANRQRRFEGLQKMRSELEDGDDLAKAIDSTLQRPELWGQKVIDHQVALDAARGLAPSEGAGADAWQSYADALRKLNDPKLTKAADRLEALASTKALDGLRDSAAVQGLAGFGSDAVGKRSGAVVGGLVGGWPGAVVGHVVGETVGPGLSAGLKPVMVEGMVSAARTLKQLAERDQKLTARLLVNPRDAGKFSRALADTSSAFSRFRGDNETDIQAFNQSRDLVTKWSNNPEALLDLVSDEFGDVANSSPKLYQQMTAQAMNVWGFLQEQMPRARNVSPVRPKGTPPTRMEMRQWALKFTAATDPQSVMADARAGRLHREQVETLKRLWPNEYEGLRNAVIQEVGPRTPPVVRQRLNILFGFDGTLDPALGKRVQGLVLKARAQYAQPSAPKQNSSYAPQRPPSVNSNMPAGEQALAIGPSLGG